MFDLGPNRGDFWSPPPAWQDAKILGVGWGVRAYEPTAPLTLVSGDLAALGTLGPRELSQGESYALRLAPDKALLIGKTAPQGFFSSDVSDGFIFFDLDGEKLDEAMAASTSYDFAAKDLRAGESCQLAFAGLRLILNKRPDGWRLIVERALAPTLFHFFAELAK